MKLGVNMLIHGLNQTLAEALALTGPPVSRAPPPST
jgi:hypothetical protein